MPRFCVILPAAGQSSRFSGFRQKKPFVNLKGRPIWVRTAEHFLNRDDVCQTILVLAPDDIEGFREQFRANLAFMNIAVVAGGATRADSVRQGLAAVIEEADHVAVHDAARPILTTEWIDAVFAAGVKYRAAIPGLKVSSTVKQVAANGTIESTLDRSRMVLAQTPQVFERKLLEKAYSVCRNPAAMTDDASVVEEFGQAVHVVPGWAMNLKITTSEDFKLAELYVNSAQKPRGLGDLHPFADERFRD